MDSIVSVQENTDIATARRTAAEYARGTRLGDEDAGALALVVTEAASNLIKHGGGGDLILSDASTDGFPLVEMIAMDRGKGMTNVGRCFTDGYSTAGSPGTGLGAIARLAKFYDVFSSQEKGTVLLAQVGPHLPPRMEHLEVSTINVPYPGEQVCGDRWEIDATAERTRFIVADGLGHGIFAAEAAASAVKLVRDERSTSPVEAIEKAHSYLKATRGAAIAVADVDHGQRSLTFAGVGNVAGSVVSDVGVRRQMISINGTLGHEMRGARQYRYPFEEGALLILHSDGISTHWSIEKYPGLFHRHPAVIAGVLFRDFRRIRDDATVVVARLRSSHL